MKDTNILFTYLMGLPLSLCFPDHPILEYPSAMPKMTYIPHWRGEGAYDVVRFVWTICNLIRHEHCHDSEGINKKISILLIYEAFEGRVMQGRGEGERRCWWRPTINNDVDVDCHLANLSIFHPCVTHWLSQTNRFISMKFLIWTCEIQIFWPKS